MRKIIAAINMALDGVCDHTALIADDEIHEHYNALLKSADGLLYGRITYQLMESSWPAIVKHPTGNPPMDEFARIIEDIPKIVFSRTLDAEDPSIVGWKNARLAKGSLEEEISALKRQAGREILLGSRSLIIAALNLGLVDEFQLNVQPIIAGEGLPLFEAIDKRIELRLLKTKVFGSGSMLFYYGPVRS